MPQRSPRLTGKRILLTGATSGVGLETAKLLAAEGAELALVARSREALDQVVRDHAPGALALPADLADRAAAERAVQAAVEQLGGLDVVVSNAASAVFGHVLDVHPDDFDRTIDVTFAGAVSVIRAALPHLRATRGTIAATGSVMTRVPLPTWSSYTAAKHALRGFLNTLAIEEREQGTGVRIAMVHPGAIDTPLFAQASSGTTRRPRVAPDAYHADVIARALVECVVAPRREVVLGGVTLTLDRLYAHARPVGELVLLLVDRWYRSGDEPSRAPGGLWEAVPEAQASGGIPARDSLLAPLQLGRRLLPSPSTPLDLARNGMVALRRGSQLLGTLARPVAERVAPAAPLRDADAEPRFDRGRVTV